MRGKKTQLESIREYMQAGNSITPLEALERFGCFRLANIIFKMKQEGEKFHTERVINKYGKRFAKYTLLTKND